MAKLTKKQKEAHSKIEKDKLYSVTEASALIKEITNICRFSSSFGCRSKKSKSDGSWCGNITSWNW